MQVEDSVRLKERIAGADHLGRQGWVRCLHCVSRRHCQGNSSHILDMSVGFGLEAIVVSPFDCEPGGRTAGDPTGPRLACDAVCCFLISWKSSLQVRSRK